jgi:uncharacterized RDD family membrane protein YckC
MARIIPVVNALLSDEPRPAGFWIRALACVIDLALLLVVQLTLAFVGGRLWGASVAESPSFQGAVALFTLLFAALYATVLHASEGQTLGKLVVGARVVGAGGERLPLGASLLRWLAGFVAMLPLGLGFLMAGLRRDKRGLHDLIAGSQVLLVVRRRRWRA